MSETDIPTAPSLPPAPIVDMPAADRGGLRRLGEQVRVRLAADTSVHRVPVERAELFAVGDFLTPAECNRFITLIDQSARPSSVYEASERPKFRTSWSGDVDPTDPFVRMVERRIDDLLGINPMLGETAQGQRYQPGQEFQPHHDWFYTTQDYWKEEALNGGQRSWTAMAYLNDVEAGGATHFPHLGVSVYPQRGALLIWNNARPSGRVNEETLHAGTPVERGVKYVITKWYRTRSWGR